MTRTAWSAYHRPISAHRLGQLNKKQAQEIKHLEIFRNGLNLLPVSSGLSLRWLSWFVCVCVCATKTLKNHQVVIKKKAKKKFYKKKTKSPDIEGTWGVLLDTGILWEGRT